MSGTGDLRPSGPAPPHALLEDGSLAVSVDAGVAERVAPWLPLVPQAPPGEGAALLRVEPGAPGPLPDGTPDMEMWSVGGWVRRERDQVLLAHPHGRIGGRVDLAERRARVRIDAAGDLPSLAEVSSALTMAAALLLGRLGRVLAHAGAVVPPGGGAWLLAGGSFSGKSSTCTTLIRHGWEWLSDDHVVLSRSPAGVAAEAWPRRFNLDNGYRTGASTGIRARVDPAELGPGRWRRAAPVAGLLFPRIEAELPTAVLPLHPARALALLVRNAPWILADAGAAPAVLALLEQAAQFPAFELRLGRDSYCNANALQFALAPALNATGATREGTRA